MKQINAKLEDTLTKQEVREVIADKLIGTQINLNLIQKQLDDNRHALEKQLDDLNDTIEKIRDHLMEKQ